MEPGLLYIPHKPALKPPTANNNFKPWTGQDEQYIRQHYLQKTDRQLAVTLGRSISGIRNRRNRLGLNDKPNNAGCFNKGIIPWNKGKTYTMPTNPTKFKKGTMPKNHRNVGSLRWSSDGYYEIKVKEPNKWMHFHRYVYELAHGPIPKGMVCRYKPDASRHTFTADDLILVTRAQHLALNHNRKKAGISLSKTNRIKRILNSVEQSYGVKFHTLKQTAMQKKITLGQYLDRFLDKFRIDDITNDPELQYLYNRIREKKSTYGGVAPLVAQGEFLELSKKHMPEIFEDHV